MGIYAKDVVIWVPVIGGKSTGESGMIRSVRMTCFPGVRRLCFIRGAVISGRLNLESTTIRFVGLPVVFTRRGGWWTDPAKLGMIRFVEITVFSGVQ